MKIEVRSVDVLNIGSKGRSLVVDGSMRIDVVEDGSLELIASNDETVGGDGSGFPSANNVYERDGRVMISRSEIGRILVRAVSAGILDLDDKNALQVIKHLAETMASRVEE